MNHDQPQVNSDVAAAEAKAEGQKLEWGPEIGIFDFREATDEIKKLNDSLSETENKWRLPTSEELLAEFENMNTSFEPDYYLSGSRGIGNGLFIVTVDMRKGLKIIKPYGRDHVRLVRDIF